MHEVLTYRANEYASMSPRSKFFIKWLRYGQSALRVLQLVAALGLLALMILIEKVPTLEGWILRITVRLFPSDRQCMKIETNIMTSLVSRCCTVSIASTTILVMPQDARLPLPPLTNSFPV